MSKEWSRFQSNRPPKLVDVARQCLADVRYLLCVALCHPSAVFAATPAADLQLDGKDQGRIEITTEWRQFEHSLLLQPTNATPAKNVSVELSPLEGPPEDPVGLTFANGSSRQSFAELAGSQTLQLKAEFPEVGEYSGRIHLRYGDDASGVVKNYEIEITKELAASTLVATQQPVLALTLEDEPIEVRLQIDLEETGKRQVTVDAARLRVIKRVDANNANWGVDTGEVMFALNGQPLNGPTTDKLIEADGGAKLEVTIPGIDAPGHYQGTVAVEAYDRSAIDATIEFMVRRPWKITAGVVFAGIVVSLLIRLWSELWQPRLTTALKVSAAIEAWGRFERKLTPQDARESDLLRQIKSQLVEHFEALRLADEKVASEFAERTLGKQTLIVTWMLLKRLMESLDYTQQDLTQQLDEIEATLLSADFTDAQLTAAKETADALRDAIQIEAKARLTALSRQLDALSKELLNSTFFDAWQTQVMKPLEAAQKALDAGVLTTSQDRLNEAGGAAARILAEDLEQRQSAIQALTLEPSERALFHRYLADAQGSGPADARMRDYQSAFGLFLIGMAAKYEELLDHVISLVHQALQDPNVTNAPALRQYLAKVETQRASLLTVPLLVRGEDFDAARKVCADAATQLRPAFSLNIPDDPFAIQSAKTIRAAGATGAPAIDPLLQAFVPIIPIGKVNPEAIGDITTPLRRWLTLGGLIYNVVVILVATTLGVLVLWAGNAQWGSTGDIMLALFWGLGLHGLATAPKNYEGLTHLAGRFR